MKEVSVTDDNIIARTQKYFEFNDNVAKDFINIPLFILILKCYKSMDKNYPSVLLWSLNQ